MNKWRLPCQLHGDRYKYKLVEGPRPVGPPAEWPRGYVAARRWCLLGVGPAASAVASRHMHVFVSLRPPELVEVVA